MTGRALRNRSLAAAWALSLVATAAAPAQARVMLQVFEMKWETLERRMPDVFMSGYGAMWLPPAARADLGNGSVGFDVFDRFDLGYEGNPTLYGTESGLDYMIEEAHRAGLLIYFDTVYNHNGFSDGYRDDVGVPPASPCQLNWAIQSGGFPGFVMSGRDLSLPFNLEMRNICPSAQFPLPSCDSDPQNCRVSNLIDINHDTNYLWVRHPVDASNPLNIPYQANRITPNNRRFYPDVDSPSPYADGWKAFNIADPMAGDAYAENVNGMLQRHTQWMLEVKRVDGFRLDAVKHMPAGWFNNIYDAAAKSRGRDFWGRQITPYSFGEYVDSNWGNLDDYHRRDAVGNRTVLDFPYFFGFKNLAGNVGANFSDIRFSSFDGFDGDGQDGSAGVLFISSHDGGFTGDPPGTWWNLGLASIMGRKGFPIVYHNAKEYARSNEVDYGRYFPNNNSRGDAMGRFGDVVTRMIDINNNFVNGRAGNFWRSLWNESDYYAYELHNTLVVGMSDWDGKGPTNRGWIERSPSNFGFRNVLLTEVTGNAANPLVDPLNEIPDTLFIPAAGSVNLRVPTTVNINNQRHDLPYVMYTIAPPTGTITVLNKAYTIARDPEPADQPYQQPLGEIGMPATPTQIAARIAYTQMLTDRATARTTPLDVLTGNTAQIELQIAQTGTLENAAYIKWNHGINIDGNNTGTMGIAKGIDSGLEAGFEEFTTSSSPSIDGGGNHTGTGLYRLDVDLTNPEIKEGYNYLTCIAYVPRLAGLPPILNHIRKVVYVDRTGPDLDVVFPATQSGDDDINGPGDYGFVVENPDGTGNSMHYFWNLPNGTDPIPLLDNSNKATRTDRKRFRFTVPALAAGDHQKLTIVVFEETGSSTIQTFDIGVAGPPTSDAVQVF